MQSPRSGARRENMKVLKGSGRRKPSCCVIPASSILKNLLHTLTKEIADLQEKHTQAQEQLNKTVPENVLDKNF
jgi:hypothetical protein